MVNLSEFKKELSKISGVDFFNPTYREVFKKYFPEDKDAEEQRLEEMGIADEEVKEAAPEVEEEKAPTEDQVEDKVEDIEKAEDEREIDKIEEEKADTAEKADEKAEDKNEESEEIGKEVDELKEDKTDDELLDAKIEIELLRNGVREDKIEKAKKLAKLEVKDMNDLDKVQDVLAEYPEWVRGYETKNFGAPVDEKGDDLTAEERRLKEMGINPR
jgi:hypothetical protein